ncbi:MAG: DUF4397 domain-containing protein [Clostridia bacterium]|nr:DUF4397 domain-containing protein [Clostridia bacterium]
MSYIHYTSPYSADLRAKPITSYVRFLHAYPGALSADIYVNGTLIYRNIGYGSFTPYLPVSPGSLNITVFPQGQFQRPLSSTTVILPAQSIFTLAITGSPGNASILTISDPIAPIPPGTVMVRTVHLSPDSPRLDMTLPCGKSQFPNMGFKNVSNYIPFNPGTYIFEADVAGSGELALFAPHINLKPNRFYTFYVVGMSAVTPPLQVLIPLDGNSYIKF